MVLPTGVDRSFFRPLDDYPSEQYVCDFSKTAIYATNGPVVLYSGHLYGYKGIFTILECAALLPGVNFYLLGGYETDVSMTQKKVDLMGLCNVNLLGMKPLSDLPKYLWASDILLLPPTADHPSAEWTSPVKLSEYCASARPIVCSDINALKRLVTDKQVWFFDSKDAHSLKKTIESVLRANNKLIDSKLHEAREYAKTNSVENRATKMLVATSDF